MPTKAQYKALAHPIKLKIRKGDQVVIISGKDKGEVGFVAAVSPKEQKVIILKENPENADQPLPLNAAIKHRKARTQSEKSARVRIPVPIHVSNVMVIDSAGKATRVGRKQEDGKVIRVSKKSGTRIVDSPVMGDSK